MNKGKITNKYLAKEAKVPLLSGKASMASEYQKYFLFLDKVKPITRTIKEIMAKYFSVGLTKPTKLRG